MAANARERVEPSPVAATLIAEARRMLELVGVQAAEVLALTAWAEKEVRRRMDALPDVPLSPDVARQYLDAITEATADLGWLRTVAAQALLEIAIEREARQGLEQRLERLERRLDGQRD